MAVRRATPKGQMSNSGLGPAIANLPIQLKSLFEPRAPLDYKPPLRKRKMPPYAGLCSADGSDYFLKQFETVTPPVREVHETPLERKTRTDAAKLTRVAEELATAQSQWNPNDNTEATEDAYKTLFVGRLSYDLTETQLRREFEEYGPLVSVKLVTDVAGQPRGYAFLQYEREEDMKLAYKRADGKKLEGRRIVVDVERGRSVKDWMPRKLGGGLGSTRSAGKTSSSRAHLGRHDSNASRSTGQYGSNPPSTSDSRRTSYGNNHGSSGSGHYGASAASDSARVSAPKQEESLARRSTSDDRDRDGDRRVGSSNDRERDRRGSSSSYNDDRYTPRSSSSRGNGGGLERQDSSSSDRHTTRKRSRSRSRDRPRREQASESSYRSSRYE